MGVRRAGYRMTIRERKLAYETAVGETCTYVHVYVCVYVCASRVRQSTMSMKHWDKGEED